MGDRYEGNKDSANVKSAEIAQVHQDKRRGRQSDAEATLDAHAQPSYVHISQTTAWEVASIWCRHLILYSSKTGYINVV